MLPVGLTLSSRIGQEISGCKPVVHSSSVLGEAVSEQEVQPSLLQLGRDVGAAWQPHPGMEGVFGPLRESWRHLAQVWGLGDGPVYLHRRVLLFAAQRVVSTEHRDNNFKICSIKSSSCTTPCKMRYWIDSQYMCLSNSLGMPALQWSPPG